MVRPISNHSNEYSNDLNGISKKSQTTGPRRKIGIDVNYMNIFENILK